MTSTTSVHVEYRPIRIGWCIDSGNFEQFEKAVRFNTCLYGGRYNPIIPIDKKELSSDLIKIFNVDALHPLCSSETKESLNKKFPWLMYPGVHEEIFIDVKTDRASCTYLDISHVLRKISKSIEWREAYRERLRVFKWENSDPLHFPLLCMLGDFPSVDECGINYREAIMSFSESEAISFPLADPIPTETWKHVPPMTLTRLALENASNMGIYVGNPKDFTDILYFWNLRAAGLGLFFFPKEDYLRIKAPFENFLHDIKQDPHDKDLRPYVHVWSQEKLSKEYLAEFGEHVFLRQIDEESFRQSNLTPRFPSFSGKTVISNLEETEMGCRMTIPLLEKPFDDHPVFMNQRVAVKIRPYSSNFPHIIKPPFIPQLNEYYGRKYYHDYDAVRSEQDGVAIITTATDSSISLSSLNSIEYFQKLFGLLGIDAKPSQPGRICTQILSQLGGLQGARLFKIPGVRSLIKKFRPDQPFSSKQAFAEIGKGIDEHKNLYLEPRDEGDLDVSLVFRYMQKKRIVRTGIEFKCPRCELLFWLSIDDCRSEIHCPYCEKSFLADTQLKSNDCWSYRRSGIFGLGSDLKSHIPDASSGSSSDALRTDEQQGSVPVALVLQQLDINLGGRGISTYYPGMVLESSTAVIPKCEVDLVLITEPPLAPTQILIGECKDEKSKIEQRDVDNLIKVSKALEQLNLEPYILFAKTGKFSEDEIAICKTAQLEGHFRVVMLSKDELEPYNIGDKYPKIQGIERYPFNLERMAKNSHYIYFNDQKPDSESK